IPGRAPFRSPSRAPVDRPRRSTRTRWTASRGRESPRGSPRLRIHPRPPGRARRGAARGLRSTRRRGRTRPGRSSRWPGGREGSVKVHVDAGPSAPPLNPEEASRLLIQEYSRMAREYDAHVTPYHAPIARRLLELARIEEGERILDIGCGTGIVAFEAAAAVGEGGSVVGIDLAERAVRLAADKAAAAGLRHVRFVVMDS